MLRTPALGRALPSPFCLVSAKSSSSVLYITSRSIQSQKLSTYVHTRRRTCSSSARSPTPVVGLPEQAQSNAQISEPTIESRPPPLSVLPLATILRTLGSTTISSSKILLPPSLAIMSLLAHSEFFLFNPNKNFLLRWFMKKTFYAQFCAGENNKEVRRTVDGLKQIGFGGVILGYAKEVVLTDAQTRSLTACDEGPLAEECIRNEISPWEAGTLETLELAKKGDFVALKFTGAGRQALYALKNRLPPPKDFKKALDRVCDLAVERDVPLLFDAEQIALQPGIDDWTLEYQRKYNTKPGHAIIYGTYQAYLKHTPSLLGSHLATASKDNFTLGVKLVRGAYLGSDPRHVIHDTKADTDAAYDSLAASLITRKWGPQSKEKQTNIPFPQVSVLLGSHNLESVCQARKIALGPESAGVELAIAQLMGMADEVSCELLVAKAINNEGCEESPLAYKYLVWGSTKDCMAYLLRRAHENKDAVQRTKSGRDAAWAELKRRVFGRVGLA
ncbi:proline dehydrogenase [Astrocystis sublimbata]|nr:proline dehydrogenase [Astrocystis sublimbata]